MLQWYLGAVARASAHLAAATAWLPLLEPARLSLRLSGPGGYPVQVGVDPATPMERIDALPTRLDRAHTAYVQHAEAFVTGYQPEVKLGSALRAGSIIDAWDAARSSVQRDWAPPPRRSSCCFIYPLPGVVECARCPRRGPA